MIPNIAFHRGRPARRSQTVRKGRGVAFVALAMSASFLGVVVLAVLLITVVRDGIGVLSLDFINSFPHYKPEEAGAKSALAGTLWVMMFTALFAIITGVGAAIYLEEFATRKLVDSYHRDQHQQPGGRAVRRVRAAGACGVRVRDGPGSQHPGGRAHPGPADTADYHRCVSGRAEVGAALPCGRRRWRWGQPAGRQSGTRCCRRTMPTILTGFILSLARAIGETAPLIVVGAFTTVLFVPSSPTDSFTVLPVQIYSWIGRPLPAFQANAAAGIIVLLVVLLLMNAVAITLRNIYSRRSRW